MGGPEDLIGPYFPSDDAFALERSSPKRIRGTTTRPREQQERRRQQQEKAPAPATTTTAESLSAEALATTTTTTRTTAATPALLPEQVAERKRGRIARALRKWLL